MLLDFAQIPQRRPPRACLACPAHWGRSDADLTTPVFAVPMEMLRESLVRIAAREPRTHLVALDREARQAAFVQRSRLFRFPDDITVQFDSLESGRATLAIYSRARHGYHDLGVNRRRVRRWLDALARDCAGSRRVAA